MQKKLICAAVLGILSSLFLTGCENSSARKDPVPFTPSEYITTATAAEPCFQIGEHVFKVGISTIQDLADSGAVFSPENQVDSLDFSEDAWYQRTLHFSLGSTNLTVQAKNVSGRISPIRESIIQGLFFDGPKICGIGGVMIGDTVEQVRQKLGEPYLIINTEDYRSEPEDAQMKSTSRVYIYVSKLDDMTVRICIDRNTSQVTLIEEKKPRNIITEPRQVTADQIRKLIKVFRKAYSGMTRAAQLMDPKGKNPSAASGTLSSISYLKFKVLTLDQVKDSKKFYLAASSYHNTAPMSSCLIMEYTAILTIESGLEAKTRQDVYGCFYLPNAYLTEEGDLSCSLEYQDYLESSSVYLS